MPLSILLTRRRRRRAPPEPYVYGPPPNLNFLYNAERLPLTRAPSLKGIAVGGHTVSPPQASLDVLPVEIRQIIWEDVLGAHRIHLESELDHSEMQTLQNWQPEMRKLHLVGYRCLASDPSICNRYHHRYSPRRSSTAPMPLAFSGPLSLLLACKRM